jgi:PhnB protein
MEVQPYLFFNGRCEEAMDFYTQAIGAEVTVKMRYADNPETPPPGSVPQGFDKKIMHATLRLGETSLMVSDGDTSEPARFKGFSLSLGVANPAQAEQFFTALSQGGIVRMPLSSTFFASRFGMVEDRFGVSWMLIAPPSA